VTAQDAGDSRDGNQHFAQGLALRDWAMGFKELPWAERPNQLQGVSAYDKSFYMDATSSWPHRVCFATMKQKRRGYLFYSPEPQECTEADRSKVVRSKFPLRAERQHWFNERAKYATYATLQ